MNFVETVSSSSFILTEGAVIERLKRHWILWERLPQVSFFSNLDLADKRMFYFKLFPGHNTIKICLSKIG